ncbi:hypothetical protein [Actinomadura logoneensis]|nr:hypothetical protein [Actinomadura logoneensis]
MTIDQGTAYRSGGVLDALESAFAPLTSGPVPLALDGTLLGQEVPSRPFPLSELIGLLYDRADGPAVLPRTRDTIWRALVDKARTGAPPG